MITSFADCSGAPDACFFFKGWMSPTLYRYVIPFDEEDLIIMKKDKTTIILVTVFYVCSVVHILRSCNDKQNLYFKKLKKGLMFL